MHNKHENDQEKLADAFAFFTEVGILNQLSRALLEAAITTDIQTIHFSVLNNLTKRGEGRLPSNLAKAFQVPRSNMTDVLAKLEGLGFICFKSNPKDGRSKLVYMTDAGHAFRQNAITQLQLPIKEIGTRFDLSVLSQMLPVLVELREVMDDMRSG